MNLFGAAFESNHLYELESFIKYLLTGTPEFDNSGNHSKLIKNIEFPAHSVQELTKMIATWLRLNYPGLIHSLTFNFMALTRTINAEVVSELRKNRYLKEVLLPNPQSTNGKEAPSRCDIIIIPKNMKLDEQKGFSWKELRSCTLQLLEIKLTKLLQQNPPEKHLRQIQDYIKSIHNVNPKLHIKPFLLQVSGMGIVLLNVKKDIEKLENK